MNTGVVGVLYYNDTTQRIEVNQGAFNKRMNKCNLKNNLRLDYNDPIVNKIYSYNEKIRL